MELLLIWMWGVIIADGGVVMEKEICAFPPPPNLIQTATSVILQNETFHVCLCVAVDFALKVIRWSDRCNIKLQLWDIAGTWIKSHKFVSHI